MKSYDEMANDVLRRIREHETAQKKKRKNIAKAAVSLCGVCLILLAGIAVWQSGWLNPEENYIEENYESIYIPPLEVSSKQDADAIDVGYGIIIYQGKVYCECDFNKNTDIVGEYLGTSTDTDELPGIVTGSFYAVKGFDPSFMICRKDHDFEMVRIFVNNNDLTLTTGADLFEGKLQLKEKLTGASYLSHDDWNKQFTEFEIAPIALKKSDQSKLNSFIDALYKAPFMYMNDVPSDGDLTAIYHVYLETDSGMTIQLSLYEGGYIRYAGLRTVCQKIDEKIFNSMIGLFEP